SGPGHRVRWASATRRTTGHCVLRGDCRGCEATGRGTGAHQVFPVTRLGIHRPKDRPGACDRAMMRISRSIWVTCGRVGFFVVLVFGQWVAGTPSSPQARADDQVKVLVGRLDLERYKATIKGLTQFGDRLQGTDRNKAAVDWIEAQLRSYGCTP